MHMQMDNSLAISVVIPTYNRPEQLRNCLAALLKQDLSEPWEVIVIDDGSQSNNKAIIDGLSHAGRIRYYRQDNQGPAKARNKGASLARGNFIAFTDDDCEPTPTWLKTLLEHSKEGVIIGGQTINGVESNLCSEACQVLIDYIYTYLYGSKVYFFTSNNFAMDRNTYLKVGGFDESFPTSAGEDRELCVRWLHYGYELKFVGQAQIHHFHRLDFRSFWRLHFKYGTAAAPFREKMKALGVNVNERRHGFFKGLFFFACRHKRFSLSQKVPLVFLLALSQVANIAGYMSGSNQKI